MTTVGDIIQLSVGVTARRGLSAGISAPGTAQSSRKRLKKFLYHGRKDFSQRVVHHTVVESISGE